MRARIPFAAATAAFALAAAPSVHAQQIVHDPRALAQMIEEARTLYSKTNSSWLRIWFAASGSNAKRMSCTRLQPTLQTASTTSLSTPSSAS